MKANDPVRQYGEDVGPAIARTVLHHSHPDSVIEQFDGGFCSHIDPATGENSIKAFPGMENVVLSYDASSESGSYRITAEIGDHEYVLEGETDQDILDTIVSADDPHQILDDLGPSNAPGNEANGWERSLDEYRQRAEDYVPVSRLGAAPMNRDHPIIRFIKSSYTVVISDAEAGEQKATGEDTADQVAESVGPFSEASCSNGHIAFYDEHDGYFGLPGDGSVRVFELIVPTENSDRPVTVKGVADTTLYHELIRPDKELAGRVRSRPARPRGPTGR